MLRKSELVFPVLLASRLSRHVWASNPLGCGLSSYGGVKYGPADRVRACLCMLRGLRAKAGVGRTQAMGALGFLVWR